MENENHPLNSFIKISLAIGCVLSFAFMMWTLAMGTIPTALIIISGILTGILFLFTSLVFHHLP